MCTTRPLADRWHYLCMRSVYMVVVCVCARARVCVCVCCPLSVLCTRVCGSVWLCVCVRFVYTSLHLLQQCTDNCRAYIFICVLLRSIVFVCVCVCAMLVYEHLLYVNRATTTPCYRLLRARGLLYSP